MNIFILDNDLSKCCAYHADTHVYSGLKEIPQMLACCFDEDKLSQAPKSAKGNIRSHAYFNHPCTKWVRESIGNFEYTIEMWKKLTIQAFIRCGTGRNAATDFINWCVDNTPNFITKELTPFATAFTVGSNARMLRDNGNFDVVTMYREYYIHDKKNLKWTNVKKPYWI